MVKEKVITLHNALLSEKSLAQAWLSKEDEVAFAYLQKNRSKIT